MIVCPSSVRSVTANTGSCEVLAERASKHTAQPSSWLALVIALAALVLEPGVGDRRAAR